MSAFAAVNGVLRIPRAGPVFRQLKTGENVVPQCEQEVRVETIRSILSQGGYTVSQLSAATGERYGAQSPFFIPPTFLYKLSSGVTPHVCQVVALSESTGHRFADWLRLCGFDLQQIPNLQIRLHRERTVLVTPVEECLDPFAMPLSPSYPAAWSSSAGFQAWAGRHRDRYLFAKIGNSDALACPRLRPGSIVRVDRYFGDRYSGDRYERGIRRARNAARDDLVWLVELPEGLTCSQVRWIDDRQIVLLPSRPPWGCWPLRLSTEARILGLVESDFNPAKPRGLPPPEIKETSPEQGCTPRCRGERMKFSELLRSSRTRTGLTFRAAHRLTRTIAQVLGNREYSIALGLLSDYEAMGRLPRHIAKVLSLCIVYCMDVVELLESAGVHIDDSAKMPLPVSDFRMPLRSEYLETTAYHPRAVS